MKSVTPGRSRRAAHLSTTRATWSADRRARTIQAGIGMHAREIQKLQAVIR